MSQKEAVFAYPAMLNLHGKECVIIGGGSVAARKLDTLCQAGAHVTVVAPQFCPQLLQSAENAPVTLLSACYSKELLQNAFLVIAATDSKEVNRQVTFDAPFLCNNVTEPELSNFTVPSAIKCGSITVAIATGGIPAYTRLLKAHLRHTLPAAFADFNDFLSGIRQEVKQIPSTPKQRTAFWRQTLTPEILELLQKGSITIAKEKILHAVNCFRAQSQNSAR